MSAAALPLADAEARTLIRSALDRTIVVEAAAGTGKTTELVHRITAVLEGGVADVDAIVAVTFTEKAAGELKLRLRGGLESARRIADSPEKKRNLERALAHLEEARVGTIHAFCADLLRERPVEARLDPQFATMTEPEAERLHAEAFDRWLEERLQSPPEGVRRSLRRRSNRGESASSRLSRAAYELSSWRDFSAPWRREPLAREAAIDEVALAIEHFADAIEERTKQGDNLYLDLEPARRFAARARAERQAMATDHDELEAAIVELSHERNFTSPRKGYGSQYSRTRSRADVLEEHAALVEKTTDLATRLDADLAALLQAELKGVTARYETLKEARGKLDFVDLLSRARDLIAGNAAVRASFQRRFRRIFVDEFQDTDPLQAEILLLLAADDPSETDYRRVRPEGGKLFVVGDPKQAIYRFRRADLAVYNQVKENVVANGGLHVHLSTSFRSVPSIQRLVNACFEETMKQDAESLQAAYVPLAPARSDAPGQPSIIALSIPEPYGYRGLTMSAIDRSLPSAVAAFIDWLLHQSGYLVTERSRPNERVPIAARHICLLFRRLTNFRADVTKPYVQALEARSIPHVLVGGKSFHEREEVETMTAALSAIEWPDDELSVYATLRGSLFAISDEALIQYRGGPENRRRLDPYQLPKEPLPEALAPIGEALSLLRSLHRFRNYRPVADTVSALLEATRAHAAFALRPSGEQALANVLYMADLGRQYDATGGVSFRGFVEELRDQASSGAAPEAPILEEGSDGVRLMTVHKAKGLELPVVICADVTAKVAHQSASRFIDPQAGLCATRLGGFAPWDLLDHEAGEVARDEAEGVRLAYVAATRARDLLVIPLVGDREFPERGWLSPLYKGLYPSLKNRRNPRPAVGCPAFGDDSVLSRPNGEGPDGANVSPGLHTFEGGYDVVFWDPSKLDLARPNVFGVPRHELLGKDAPDEVVAADVAAYEAWKNARDVALEAACTPSLVVETATARGRRMDAPVPLREAAPVVEVARDLARPGGPRFGTLVHAVLATAPLDADAARIERVARMQGRALGATEEEIAKAAEAVSTALTHDLFERARAAEARGEIRRETPVTIFGDDGALIEGTIDMAFREEGRWTVVDFKTDRALDEVGLAAYRRQISLYAEAIEVAMGEPATAVLLKL